MSGRTIVIGDIHGCYDELRDLLDRLALDSDDRVVAVGDLIVKGWKNREVLDLFIGDERFRAVLGNHDRAILRYLRGKKRNLKESQKKALAELEVDEDHYFLFLQSLPNMIDLGSHLVVHAGLRPGVALPRQKAGDLTELRTLGRDRKSRKGTPWYEVYDGEKIVLFGHWPAANPRLAPRAIGLDTGCVYGNRLTAYILETGEFVSVQSRCAYDPPKRPLV
ncbi:MAG: metallophosphoesterase [Acidobacteriota bacterium]|nr:metallophosphoesterase [Acidobacteriota bacterium]